MSGQKPMSNFLLREDGMESPISKVFFQQRCCSRHVSQFHCPQAGSAGGLCERISAHYGNGKSQVQEEVCKA